MEIKSWAHKHLFEFWTLVQGQLFYFFKYCYAEEHKIGE